jgi:hypothetical protein
MGRLPRTAFYTSEVWAHPDGKHVYLGTTLGGDRIYAIDVSNPAKPGDHRLDHGELAVDERPHDDRGRQVDGVHSARARPIERTASSSRRRPTRPPERRSRSSPTASPPACHSAFVNTQAKYGTFVYLTNSGTGSLDIIDINDPLKPKRVATWQTKETRAGARCTTST